MAYWLAMHGAQPYRLDPGVDVTIGRGQHCELSVYSTLLSREHARVRWEGEQPVLFDLESLNGCFIGPDRISRHVLKDGDVIRLGDLPLLFRESDAPPAPPTQRELPLPFDLEEEPEVGGNETRLFSRTQALHQRVFEYDELRWLRRKVKPFLALLGDPCFEESGAAWFSRLPGPHALWELLRYGVVAPRDVEGPLGSSPAELATTCELTRRGRRLRELESGRKVHWNEMAALRYRVRQTRVFQPLRYVARAYRPGGGLRELDVPRLLYELRTIYAADLGPEEMELSLRRLLCLGFLRPTENAEHHAWWPAAWENGAVKIAERGYAMLEGFRLED